MSIKENSVSFLHCVRERLTHAKKELLNDPVLETSIAFSLFTNRLVEVTYLPAFYLTSRLSETTSLFDGHWTSSAIVGASLVTMSLTEYYAINRKRYCNNSNTNLLNLALDNSIAGICGSKIWSFVTLLSPTNPIGLGIVSYSAVTSDWGTLLNFLAARNIVKTIYNSSMDVLIATERLDPVYSSMQKGKDATRKLVSRLRSWC